MYYASCEQLSCCHRDQLDNLLDDDAMIGTQLDQISTIARLVYDKTCNLLIRLFDDVAGRYQEQLQHSTDAWQLINGMVVYIYVTIVMFPVSRATNMVSVFNWLCDWRTCF